MRFLRVYDWWNENVNNEEGLIGQWILSPFAWMVLVPLSVVVFVISVIAGLFIGEKKR